WPSTWTRPLTRAPFRSKRTNGAKFSAWSKFTKKSEPAPSLRLPLPQTQQTLDEERQSTAGQKTNQIDKVDSRQQSQEQDQDDNGRRSNAQEHPIALSGTEFSPQRLELLGQRAFAGRGMRRFLLRACFLLDLCRDVSGCMGD